ncbi:DUF4123 domain-containing protein [Caballeronia sp. AZ10_KS36]|uniref:DUF4123 domain-containing protein n=1 Tax=Caballeronia sp. AZ10_KS36 TaxID=2921757 RepID=UPI002028B361|nr:DUF4123 domain-containing protein [Caballeronia sp. AZ10_KS36]
MAKQTLQEAWSTRTHLLADRLLIQDWSEDLPWHAVAPESLEKEAHLLPVVLGLEDLDEVQQAHVQAMLEMRNPQTVAPALLVRSDRSAEALARALSHHVTVTLSDESRVLLRFADPVVFAHLLWILPLEGLSSLCEATLEWSIPFQGEWHEIQFTDRPQPRWEPLDEPRSVALYNVALTNRVLAKLPPIHALAEFWREAQRANKRLCTAQDRFGLTDGSDCVAFAAHSMAFGDGIASHKTLASWLSDARDKPGLYAKETDALSRRDWDGIQKSVQSI